MVLKDLHDLLRKVDRNKAMKNQDPKILFGAGDDPNKRPPHATPEDIYCGECTTWISPEVKELCHYCGHNEAR